ncbi:MAG TPA: HAD-IA family hydrolase, partial [Egibacteraceae bacterium]
MSTSAPLRAAAVLFDLDGVLVDSGEGVARAWRGWAPRYGLDPDEVITVAQGRRSIDTIRELAPHADAEREAAELEDAEVGAAGSTRPYPGASELLQALDGVPWAVVTSCTRRLASARLTAAGLPLPPAFVTADEVSAGKPDPEGYLLGARRLGVPADACVVIEDAPAGVAAGRAAGATVVAVATTHAADELAEADLVVPRLADLCATVADGTVEI